MVIEKKKPIDKIKGVFDKIGKRNLIIALAVVLVGAAVWINWAVIANTSGGGYGGYNESNGMDNSYTGSGEVNGGTETTDWYTSAQVSRNQARDEALEVLQSVVDDEAASAEAKAAAYTDMTKLAKNMENETNIETLVVAKGFEKCVAVVNEDDASIIVSWDGELTPAQLSQINEIVYVQSGIEPVNVKIICK
ncbi:MAG: SpoIIIAH-like family protein [Ruminococcaceae bacterium]|nr:SpoIIIAH-like family protein [Oscillospiraceae bacterium]